MKFVPGKGYVFEASPPPSEKAKEDRRLINGAKTGKNKADPVEAIARRCIECVYDPLASGSAMDQIRGCRATACPLFPFRPKADETPYIPVVPNRKDSENLQRKDVLVGRTNKTERAAIGSYCADCLYDAAETGTWREQVRACITRGCDLYMVRPK